MFPMRIKPHVMAPTWDIFPHTSVKIRRSRDVPEHPKRGETLIFDVNHGVLTPLYGTLNAHGGSRMFPLPVGEG